jgi:hypothetical protein
MFVIGMTLDDGCVRHVPKQFQTVARIRVSEIIVLLAVASTPAIDAKL